MFVGGWIIAAGLMPAACSGAAEIAVIVSSKSPVSSITPNQVADIFLARIATFPTGARAVPIDQPEGSPVRDEFYEKTARKSVTQLRAYWLNLIFTGKGEPPVVAADGEAVKRAVVNNPNAVGYIRTDLLDDSVKMLLLLP
ncbi:phosphate ABC transporter substrate-binding protein [Noviherbaspirillum saxi]|uniref:Phosphate ABC transporter substrate-binding protein n=2 Tax=Noviherbaspirillum saxi TaxID=2320863 RepID=A0A3A3FWM2_9BURK|nr:phosphate ABC transporter substrate-binding protein [Noviherbaspirillum saxi]